MQLIELGSRILLGDGGFGFQEATTKDRFKKDHFQKDEKQILN